MPRIGNKRDTPSFPRTTDEEPAKKTIKKEIPDGDAHYSQKTNVFERTISSNSEGSSEADSSSTTSESSSEADSSSTTSESSSEADSSSTTSESSSETETETTSSVSNIPIYRLSLAQLLDRLNFQLSKDQKLAHFKILGTPSRNKFKEFYKQLVLKVHPDKVGKEYEELFKLINPICQELLKKLP